MRRNDILSKPRLRGVSHKWAAIVCVPLGIAMIAAANGARAHVAIGIYAVSVVALFAVSSTYHRINWRTAAARQRMRRLDHTMIFVMIAGSYTPIALLVLHGTLATSILIAIWVGAIIGATVSLAWPTSPTWLDTCIYIALGWIAAIAIPQIVSSLDVTALILLALGGALYSVGAIIYATRRPDPNPAVFGYHEVFHALVIAAAGIQYAVIAFWVLPR